MLAVSISNTFAAPTPPVSPASSLHAGVAQPSSPSAALFQTEFKTRESAEKLPAADKAKDSARAQDVPAPIIQNTPPIAYRLSDLAVPPQAHPAQPLAPESGPSL